MKALLATLLLVVPVVLHAEDAPPPPADLMSPPASAQRLADGLVTNRVSAGTGTEKPAESDILRMRYTVWRSDGSVVGHLGAPRTVVVPAAKMLPGWREAAMLMVVGEKRRAWVPASLGGGRIPAGDQFVFDTELIEIIHRPGVPEDVAAPSVGAIITKSGLAYRVLRPGTGTDHPSSRSKVVVHYSGWTLDGRMFDSSIVRGEPSEFGVLDVIRGWTEGLQLMVVGEKARFWIPPKLAYGNEPGKPHGMLVFDIELLEIK